MTEAQIGDEALTALLALQTVDAHIAQLGYQREHHPARVALNELLARHKKLAEQSAPLEVKVAAFDAHQGQLESEIGEAAARIATIEGRLKAGTAGSYRDEGAMSEEISSLRRRKAALEDQELEVMEAREPVDAELATLRTEDAATGERARNEHAALTAAEVEIDTLIKGESISREELARKVQPELLKDYERIRSRLDGVGVARLEHGMCSGCNLALSAGERDRITHGAPGERFHCDQCGRILVP